MQFYIPPDGFNTLHNGAMTVKYVNGEPIGRAEFLIHMAEPEAETFHPGEAMYFPLVIPIQPLAFPRPGQVDVNISINGSHCGSLTFWILEPATPPGQIDGD